MRADAEQQLQQAAKQQRLLEEKLTEVERNALLMRNNTEQIHREQLEAEHKQTVNHQPVDHVAAPGAAPG